MRYIYNIVYFLLCEEFKKHKRQNQHEENQADERQPREVFVILVMFAMAVPLAMHLVGEITAMVARRHFVFRSIEARLVVELASFGFLEIEKGHFL